MITTVDIFLNSVYFDRVPTGTLSVNDKIVDLRIDQPITFSYKFNLDKDSTISIIIDQFGKTNKDTQGDLDTAIIIEKILINGLESPKFAWAGVYTPDYPAHYIKQNPTAKPQLTNINYLGWNGRWQLDISVPAFTWIHKLENLGWIYE